MQVNVLKIFSMKKVMALLLVLTAPHWLMAQLVLQSGAVLKTTGNALITLQNTDMVNNTTLNQLPGEGRFVFAGTADNTISGSGTSLFDVLEIAKTGTAKLSLLQNISVGSSVNFITGLIDLNKNNLYLKPAALFTGENENSRITGIAGGYVEITNTLNAPSAFNSGNLGAVISSAQNLGSTVIRRGHVSQVNGSGNGSSIYRYYDIAPANNSSLNATLRINYFDAELNGLTENTLTQWKSNNTTTWFNMGYNVRDAIANYVTQRGLADFSRWTLSSAGNVLPVTFISFTAGCNNGIVLLIWKTAQEQNSHLFEIEKSEDGINFTTIATVPAAGNSSTEKTYTYSDSNTSPATRYYRIAEKDINGATQLTAINRIKCGEAASAIKYWPNPMQADLFLSIPAASAAAVCVKIFDSKGALVLVQYANLLRGNNQLKVNTRRLVPGSYNLLISWDHELRFETIKLIKQ